MSENDWVDCEDAICYPAESDYHEETLNEFCTRNGVPVCDRLIKMQQMLRQVLKTIPHISYSDIGIEIRKELDADIRSLLEEIDGN